MSIERERVEETQRQNSGNERKTERREGVASGRECKSEVKQKKNEQVEERSRWKL